MNIRTRDYVSAAILLLLTGCGTPLSESNQPARSAQRPCQLLPPTLQLNIDTGPYTTADSVDGFLIITNNDTIPFRLPVHSQMCQLSIIDRKGETTAVRVMPTNVCDTEIAPHDSYALHIMLTTLWPLSDTGDALHNEGFVRRYVRERDWKIDYAQSLWGDTNAQPELRRVHPGEYSISAALPALNVVSEQRRVYIDRFEEFLGSGLARIVPGEHDEGDIIRWLGQPERREASVTGRSNTEPCNLPQGTAYMAWKYYYGRWRFTVFFLSSSDYRKLQGHTSADGKWVVCSFEFEYDLGQ